MIKDRKQARNIKYMVKARLLVLLLCYSAIAVAQKPFTEGVITYSVKLKSPDGATYSGTYVYTIKGGQIRKELHLNNNYEDVIIMNCPGNQAWSLKNINGERYAIELSMDDLNKTRDRYTGFTIANETGIASLAGVPAYKATVLYKGGQRDDVIYTKDWYPNQPLTFSRFPDSKFFPLGFSLTEETGSVMRFDVLKLEAQPVESALFRIPADYKMVPYEEYKKMRK